MRLKKTCDDQQAVAKKAENWLSSAFGITFHREIHSFLKITEIPTYDNVE